MINSNNSDAILIMDQFPKMCRRCGEQQVTIAEIPYTLDVKHDGRVYAISVPHLRVPTCQHCGEKSFDETVDEQVSDALRTHLGLLSPIEIRAAIKAAGLTQKELAGALGIAEATLSRWISGAQIQSKGMDNFLRVYFGSEDAQRLLSGERAQNAPNCGSSDESHRVISHRRRTFRASNSQWTSLDPTRAERYSRAQTVIENRSTWSSVNLQCA